MSRVLGGVQVLQRQSRGVWQPAYDTVSDQWNVAGSGDVNGSAGRVRGAVNSDVGGGRPSTAYRGRLVLYNCESAVCRCVLAPQPDTGAHQNLQPVYSRNERRGLPDAEHDQFCRTAVRPVGGRFCSKGVGVYLEVSVVKIEVWRRSVIKI